MAATVGNELPFDTTAGESQVADHIERFVPGAFVRESKAVVDRSVVVENEQVATALASHGFTQEQVNQKLAQMSQQDLHQLARNLDQLQAAGLTRQESLWVLIGAVAALIIIIALTD